MSMPAPARAGDLTIRQIGAWGGSVDAIHVEEQGDQRIAYIGSGVNLVILDVTDPANIIELGSVMLEGVIMDVKVRDGYAYIGATRPAWFSVVDVHDPAAPFLVATGVGHDGAGGLFKSVELDGNRPIAWVTPTGSASQRYDISNPRAPVYCGECSGGGGVTVFSGSIQYTIDDLAEILQARDLSDVPPAPCPGTRLGTVEIPNLYSAATGLIGIALGGDYVYVTAGFLSPHRHSLLFTVNFSDLSAPVLVNTWGDPTGEELHLFQAVAFSDGRLYWAGNGRPDPLSRTLVILDVTEDPGTPTLIGEYSSAAKISDIEVVGTTAYLGDIREGLTILDCSDPANISRVSNYFSPNRLQQGALDGDKLYVTDKFYGVSVLDVSDPRVPRLAGKWETGSFTADRYRPNNWGIAVRDDLAYVAAGYAGLQVLDVSDPGAPSLAGEFSPWPDGKRSVGLTLAPDEPIVHLGVVPGAWIVNFNVSNLSNITDPGAIFIDGFMAMPFTIVRRADGIAYVARDNALVTVNLSAPERPTLIEVTGPAAVDLALDEGPHESYVHAVSSSRFSPQTAGLHILWVSPDDPVPARVGHYDDEVTLATYAVATHPVHRERVYMGLHPLSLRVIDVRMPWYPLLMASAPCARAIIVDLIVDGTTVYAITDNHLGGGAGVLVYQVFYPGDVDDDADVDLRDYATLQRCFSGGAGLPLGRAGADCLIFDFDEDDDVDGADYAAFAGEMTEPR